MIYNILLTTISILIANRALSGIISFINKQIFLASEMSNFEVFIINNNNCVLMSLVLILISAMAELFGIDKSGISRHLSNVFKSGELDGVNDTGDLDSSREKYRCDEKNKV